MGSCNSVLHWYIQCLHCFKGWEIAAWIPLGCKRIAESDSREGRGQTFPPRRLVFKIEWTLTPPPDYIVTQLREDRQTPKHSDYQTPRCQTQKFKNWFNPTARERDFCSVPAHHESPDWLWEVWSAPAAFVHMAWVLTAQRTKAQNLEGGPGGLPSWIIIRHRHFLEYSSSE